MARKPNYRFERQERERIKAEKKAKRAAEKRAAQEAYANSKDPDGVETAETETSSETE